MAKAAAARKPKNSGGASSLIWLQGLACGGMAALAPMAVLQVVLLLAPGLASLATEHQEGKPITRAMLLFGLAASVEPIRFAWVIETGPGWDQAADLQAIALAWAAAATGWLLARALPVLVRLAVDASHDARIATLQQARTALVRDWGLDDEVPGGTAGGTARGAPAEASGGGAQPDTQ